MVQVTGSFQSQLNPDPDHHFPDVDLQIYGGAPKYQVVLEFPASTRVHSLSPEEQKVTAIGGSNYGEASAVDLFGPKYGLPKAISTANNYWIWGPRNYSGESLILMDEDSLEKYAEHCKSLRLVTRPHDPYARPDENYPSYHCVGLTPDLQSLWPTLKPWK